MELLIDRDDLTVAEIASVTTLIGVRNGFSGGVKDPDQMAFINNDVPAAEVWFNNGINPAISVSTLKNDEKIEVWLFSSGIPDRDRMKAIASEIKQAFEEAKHNKSLKADAVNGAA